MTSNENRQIGDELVGRPPVIYDKGMTFDAVTDKIGSVVLTPHTPLGWIAGFLFALAFVGLFGIAVTWLFVRGVGIWGIDIPVAWGFAIVNFVWWIGIGHAGTLISAILLLLHQRWRTSINRFAEAMTIFAVACAGMFPLLHLGRPKFFYFLLPYPSTMGVWPQFRSPLVWDVFAVSTYGTVSLLFWLTGLLPDFATLRDTAKNRWVRTIFGVAALGWRGSALHWQRYEMAYLLLAGIATPLVVSVHTVVSFDFAVSVIPGWHTTIFPPYFVAGAIFSGFAMVLMLVIPIRAAYKMHDLITMRHIENMGKILLVTGWMVAYGYIMETFFAWYSGDVYEQAMMQNRMFGAYAIPYAIVIFCNVLTPQLLWFKRIRTSVLALFVISLVIQLGMWMERFVIVVQSLHHDFLPSSWGMYYPTIWDFATLFGTIGFFLMCIFLFLRFLPMISISEVQALLPQAKVKEEHDS